jgi:hypothetical protein
VGRTLRLRPKAAVVKAAARVDSAVVAARVVGLLSSPLVRCRSSPTGILICKASGVLRIITTIRESKDAPRLRLVVVAGGRVAVRLAVVLVVARHPAAELLRRLPAVLLLVVPGAGLQVVALQAVVGEAVPVVVAERQQPLARAAGAVLSRRLTA